MVDVTLVTLPSVRHGVVYEDRAEAKVGTASMMYNAKMNILINFIANYMQMWRTYCGGIEWVCRRGAQSSGQ